jgi:GT2 family glycosyltransferase
MELSIIIVNWNSIEFTKNCIASIHSTTHDIDYEIIVVDNASQDDCCRIVSAAYPLVKVVSSSRNVGFARANNLGFDNSRGKRILFLNPDTLILADAIQRMAMRLDSAPEFGAVGCRLLNGDSSLQLSCVQPFPTIINQILAIDWLRRCCPRLPLWGMRALFSKSVDEVIEVEVVSGACLMVKREVFDIVGRFSTEYFMYAEEMDLCYKIRSAGWKVCHVADAQVVHFGGQSTKKKGEAFAEVVMRDSIFNLLRKVRGNAYAQAYRTALFVSAVARLTLLSPLLAIPSRLLERDAVLRTIKKWFNIATWTLFLKASTYQLEGTQANSIPPGNN